MDRLGGILRNAGPTLRIWATIATVAWGIMTVLWGCEKFMDPRNDFADGGAEGPYAVHVAALTNDGLPVFGLDGPIETVEPGHYVGWISHLCLEQGVSLLTRPDIMRISDGAVIASAHDRLWMPEDRRCGTAVGGILIPADTKYGLYELRRMVWAHPLSWFPQRAQLVGFRFRIAQATKHAP